MCKDYREEHKGKQELKGKEKKAVFDLNEYVDCFRKVVILKRMLTSFA